MKTHDNLRRRKAQAAYWERGRPARLSAAGASSRSGRERVSHRGEQVAPDQVS